MIRYMILPPSLRWPKFLLYNFPEIGRSIEPDIKIMKYSCVSLRLLATAICTAKKKKKKKKKSFVGETELGYNAFYKTSIHNRAFGCELRASFPFANV